MPEINIILIALIIAFAVVGVVVYTKLNRRIASLVGELNNVSTNFIEVTQEHEQHEFLMESINYITLSLLGMPDDDLEQFDEYLIKGINSVSITGELDAIRVYRNLDEGGQHCFVKQLSWEGEKAFSDKESEIFSYETTPGLYERLAALKHINKSAADLSDAERAFAGTHARSVLIVPVYFQERFWGTVWYEDYTNAEPFAHKRVSFLRSSALMIVSAIHRKWQASNIAEAARRTKLMLEAMPICCFLWDKERDFFDANAMGKKLFQFETSEDVAKNFWKASPEFQPNGRRSVEMGHEKLFIALNEGECAYEWMHCIPDTNELVPADVLLKRIFYDGCYIVAGYVHDIREHKRMINEIKHRESLLHAVNDAASTLLQSESDFFDAALFRSLSMMAQAVDVKRIFVWEYFPQSYELEQHESVNNHFVQIYEWEGDAEIFKRQDTPVECPFDKKSFLSLLLRGQSIMGLTHELPENARGVLNLAGTKNYHIIPIFMQSRLWGIIGFGDILKERGFSESEEAILRSGGLLIANAFYRHQMTENIKVNTKKLAKALEEAQSANKAKSRFLSTMSHEIRTPMNAILGMSAIGRSADSTERKNYAFDKLTVSSKHLLGIINDILDMSKIEAGMFMFSHEPFELERLLDDVLTVIQFRIEEKSQKLSVEIDPRIPKIIISDIQRIAQVLINLLSNASKFTEKDKKIILRSKLQKISQKDCVIRFDIIDEGIGLSSEQQGKLFHSFVQAEDDTTRKYGGTGLGLAISKYIVKKMGGDIWVESELGTGATFSFTVNAGLPTDLMLEKLLNSQNEKEEALSFPGRRLLLAEDVDINREIVMV
ncbi:MAG: hypothetical protein LBI27_04550, partial [Clostridiales bacterium]|nr:hypothetical protein [Clostridiales bacterium]